MPGNMSRRTRERKAMLELFDEMKRKYEHLSAEEIFIRLKQRLPEISLSTVYRNLEKFARDGLIMKLEYPDAPARYDANTEPHQHIRCVVCGRVDDINVSPKLKFDKAAVESSGYKLVGVRIDFYGVCPECQKKRKTQHY